jgi:hypothetical protein
MILAISLLSYRKRSLKERLGKFITLLKIIEPGKILETTRDKGMLGTKSSFSDTQGFLQDRLHLGISLIAAILVRDTS